MTTIVKDQPHKKSFGEQADAFLLELYKSVGAETTLEKINLIQMKLGGVSNFYALGGEINDEMKLACLEYEYLEQEGKITLVLA
jgi:hypothetical protein